MSGSSSIAVGGDSSSSGSIEHGSGQENGRVGVDRNNSGNEDGIKVGGSSGHGTELGGGSGHGIGAGGGNGQGIGVHSGVSSGTGANRASGYSSKVSGGIGHGIGLGNSVRGGRSGHGNGVGSVSGTAGRIGHGSKMGGGIGHVIGLGGDSGHSSRASVDSGYGIELDSGTSAVRGSGHSRGVSSETDVGESKIFAGRGHSFEESRPIVNCVYTCTLKHCNLLKCHYKCLPKGVCSSSAGGEIWEHKESGSDVKTLEIIKPASEKVDSFEYTPSH
ncbi:uncharacterized protein LOC143235041 isoform X2 [Tachypleus tridentatus]|uniref:uncharacterized protein LOC143235041 isoform X2 n=1 Tax=Tachypleus tridentatus TaxID=6853 RepID=UPI003FD45360